MSIRTQIFLNGTQLDLLEDISIPTTYSIVDIREPEKRNTTYTKTITIPGSQENNKIFSHIWNIATVLNTSGTTQTVNFSPNFNPNLKADVLVMIDGCTTIRGYMQLNSIDIEEYSYKILYNCTIFGNLANIFQTLGDSRLSDLDLSEYDHVYNQTNQSNSWATSIIKNGGTFVNFSGGNPTGEGYVYGMIDYGYNNGMSYNVTEFFPAVYAKTIVDKIIGDAGFNWSPDFIGDSFFKRLIVPFSGDALRLTDTQIQNRTFRAQNNATWNIAHDQAAVSGLQTLGNVAFQDDTTTPNFDTGGVYNTSLFRFTAANPGTYKISAEVSMNLTHFPSGASVSYSGSDVYSGLGRIMIRKNNSTVFPNSVSLGMLQGASSVPVSAGEYYFSFKQATLTSGTTNCSLTVPIQWQGTLAAGDYINIYMATSAGSQNGTATTNDLYKASGASRGYTRINVLTDSFFRADIADTKLQEGDTVTMSNVLPQNIKQSDFLLSIIKMFNLYLDQDPNQPNKLIVDTRDNFYSSGTTRYWDTKLDYGKPRTKTPMGELDARTYVFKYKEDKDYYNETYDKKWYDNYGLKRYSITNDFLKDEAKTELIFSPTPLADYVGIDRVLPKIFSVDSNGVAQPKPSNIRILYYGGLKATNTNWNYVSTSGTTTYLAPTTYPYCGHLDDPFTPTLDLSYGVPKEVFYTIDQFSYTDNNLFNAYWQKAIQEMTDPDSYIFSGWFKLTAVDIMTLDFRDTFYIDGQLFRLNKIYDYDPTQNELTKCEFVKLKDYPAYVAQTKTGYGGYGTGFTNGEYMPTFRQMTVQSGNYSGSSSRMGQNNFIAQTSVGCNITGGSDCRIGEGCTNVNILSSSGVTVLAGLSNVTVMNSSGTTVSNSDVVIIGTTAQGYKVVPILGNYTVQFTECLILANVTTIPPAGFVVTLPSTGYDGFTVEIKKTDSSVNQLTITAQGTLDGTATWYLGTQWESITVMFYGGNWYIV